MVNQIESKRRDVLTGKDLKSGYEFENDGSLRIFIPNPNTSVRGFRPLEAQLLDLESEFGEMKKVSHSIITTSEGTDDKPTRLIQIANGTHTKFPEVHKLLIRLQDANPPKGISGKVKYLFALDAVLDCVQTKEGTEMSIQAVESYEITTNDDWKQIDRHRVQQAKNRMSHYSAKKTYI